MPNSIIVSMGEYVVGQNDVLLETHGVGSCLAICIYCADQRLGMMAHAMLPTIADYQEKGLLAEKSPKAKFVDQAIDNMVKDFQARGIGPDYLVAKIVGGAKIFSIFSSNGGSIGERNVDAAEKKCLACGVKLAKEDVGGTCGRSVSFNTRNGLVDVSVKI